MGTRKGGGGSSRSSWGVSGANPQTVMLSILGFIIGLVMVGLAMTVIADMLDDNTITWTNYSGVSEVWGIFPLVMGFGVLSYSGMLGWLGAGGRQVNMKAAIMAPLLAIFMVIMAPVIMPFIEDITGHDDVADFSGITIYNIFPLLYAFITLIVPGFIGYLGVRGKIR